jgi:hypothetical protein
LLPAAFGTKNIQSKPGLRVCRRKDYSEKRKMES